MIEAERISLAEALTGVPDDCWAQESLCRGWTIRDVVGHLIATASMTPPGFFLRMAKTGFRFPVMAERAIGEQTSGRSTDDLVERYRSLVGARTGPPGPATSWLGETIVHGEDIFRSLGGYREHPIEHVLAVADFYRGSNMLIGAKRRIAGVRLSATDADWSTGTGPEATGPAIALVLAMTGRTAALDDLTGEGVAVLRSRC